MPRVSVEIVGDASSGNAAFKSFATTATTSYKATTVAAEDAAAAQVAASLKTQQALEKNIVGLRAYAAASTTSAAESTKANLLADAAQAKLNRSLGIATVSTRGFGSAAQSGERDLNKFTRGALSGSGILSSLGKSLAFASSGFIAFAVGAELIKRSVDAAEQLGVAQRQVNTQLQTSGKSWKQYGGQIDAAIAKESQLSAFNRTDLLTSFGYLVRVTGNVSNALKLNSIAAEIARARNISLGSAATALAKALGGSATALKRVGVTIPKTLQGWQALNYVQAKFAGQAKAGITVSDRLNEAFVTAEQVIGKALLPSVAHLVDGLTAWLDKMEKTGKLQKDVNSILSTTGGIFHAFGSAVKLADDVTGSFKNTLEALIALRFGVVVAGWIGPLTTLAAKWGLVAGAASAAEGAQTSALAAGAAGGAAGAARGVEGAAGGAVLGLSTIEITAIVAAVIAALDIQRSSTFKRIQGDVKKPLGHLGFIASSGLDVVRGFANASRSASSAINALLGNPDKPRTLYFTAKQIGTAKTILAGVTTTTGLLGPAPGVRGPFGGQANPPVLDKTFALTAPENIAAAQAGLTKSTADDVAAARGVIARVKRKIAQGTLSSAALIQALQAEGTALSTLWSAEDAAAQKRAAKAAAAKQKIQAQLAASIDPLKLEIALSRAEALGQSTVPELRKLLAAARAALAKGLTGALEKQAYDQITSLKAAIKSATTAPTVQFTESAKLALALARDQALGLSQTKDLLKLRKAILKFIRTHKHNIAALTDAYNQLANVNQQLGAAVPPPPKHIPKGARGAYGQVINPRTDRPIHVHTHIDIDGKRVADNTTKHQQKRRRRNPGQRRGPQAGNAYA